VKRDAADRRWSRAVRERDEFTCQRCGTKHAENSFGLHAAHVFSRGIQRTRHDLDNGLSLCYGDHRWYDSRSREEREEFARSILGDVRYEALRERARNPRKRFAAGS
jgi:hypothetical protein